MNIKNGIGAGIILNGKLYRGYYGFGGEIGDITFSTKTEDSQQSIPCFEDYSSTQVILDLYYKKTGAKPEHPSSDWLAFVDGVMSGDSACLYVMNQMRNALAAGLISVVNMLEPKCIFLGGDAGPLIPIIIPYLKEEIRRRRFFQIGDVMLEQSRFLSNASFVGISALVIENLWHRIYR